MNFLEAWEANKTEKVRVAGDKTNTGWRAGQLRETPSIPASWLGFEWEVVKEPRRIWVNSYPGDGFGQAHLTKESADRYTARAECVEFVEVMK